tara:strand:+ start:16803 stop:17753 length:951 start_codon:yes stop_codon:yes gene_type:complete
MRLIVTGCSGFIGFHCCNSLLNQGHEVIGIDNISDYYSTKLKNDRLTILNQFESFNFFKHDLKKTLQLELKREVDVFIHLAAQPGVRLPLTEYYRYDLSNILGFSNILNFISNFEIKNLIFASSSSVYGGNTNPVFSETDSLDPKSYYALTKLHNENTAKIFSLERNMNIVGLRFFTVYGPFGRPDMAYFSFLESLYKNEDINLFNNGLMFRDMTYITDIIDGIMRTIEFMRSNDNIFEIFNLGNDTPIQTIELLNKLENLSGSKAKIINLDSSGEVKHTHADLSKSRKLLGYDPKVDLNQGLYEFHEWYKSYFVK